jgi:hypothetical protein
MQQTPHPARHLRMVNAKLLSALVAAVGALGASAHDATATQGPAHLSAARSTAHASAGQTVRAVSAEVLVPNDAIAGVSIGEAKDDIRWPFMVNSSRTRSYSLPHSKTLLTVEFDRADRAQMISSDSNALSLYGRRLSAGFGAFASELRHRGWTFSTGCAPNSHVASLMARTSARDTSITWTGNRTLSVVAHGLLPLPLCPPTVTKR